MALHQVDVTADVTLTETDFSSDGTEIARMNIETEEEEGLLVLSAPAVISVESAQLDWIIDGTRLGGAAGLIESMNPGADQAPVNPYKVVRVAPGSHLIQLVGASAGGGAIVEAGSWTLEVTAHAMSHISTLAFNVNAKGHGIQES